MTLVELSPMRGNGKRNADGACPNTDGIRRIWTEFDLLDDTSEERKRTKNDMFIYEASSGGAPRFANTGDRFAHPDRDE